MTAKSKKHTNKLAASSSPYLLQHAHNPVDWQEWGDEALQQAKTENKPLLISIGYSACHWCHVMERESFEDTAIAAIMNKNFVCIKVDREERPDIDQIYMDAVQLMTNSGGWPLNCFAMPDGKPFFGGTYFPPDRWADVLTKIAAAYNTDYEKVLEYAENLAEGIKQQDLMHFDDQSKADSNLKLVLDEAYNVWQTKFDLKEGGRKGAPKFPMPNNYQFLLEYALLSSNEEAKAHVKHTLKKMAYGGIYDQIGGGFARYSVDDMWKVPHFEKMLYDNAQLIELYSKAYAVFQDADFKKVVYQSFDFLKRELQDKNGGFYAALDADSEGEEGRFYIWTEQELQQLLSIEQYAVAKSYYSINSNGYWEDDKYILLRLKENSEVADFLGIEESQLLATVAEIEKILMQARSQRIRPGLDNKILTSWNALAISGLVAAYQSFGDAQFLEAALASAAFIEKNMKREDGGLWHVYNNGKSSVNGHAEDYSFCIEAYISLYEATFDEKWIHEARFLAAYTIDKFYDDSTGFFFFTSSDDEELVTRKRALDDNVTPSSNSSLAKGLHLLGVHLENDAFLRIASQIMNASKSSFAKYPVQYSNYGMLMLREAYPFYEIAICGDRAHDLRKQMQEIALSNVTFAGSTEKSDLPLVKNRNVEGKTLLYVCVEKACKRPVDNANEALKLLN